MRLKYWGIFFEEQEILKSDLTLSVHFMHIWHTLYANLFCVLGE